MIELTAEYLSSQGLYEDFPQRFWPKVTKTESCWLWTACKMPNGYGLIGRGGEGNGMILAHRASWILHNGPIPVGLFVLHSCDNRQCVNPGHLWLGTQFENLRDMRAKGRSREFGKNAHQLEVYYKRLH